MFTDKMGKFICWDTTMLLNVKNGTQQSPISLRIVKILQENCFGSWQRHLSGVKSKTRFTTSGFGPQMARRIYLNEIK